MIGPHPGISQKAFQTRISRKCPDQPIEYMRKENIQLLEINVGLGLQHSSPLKKCITSELLLYLNLHFKRNKQYKCSTLPMSSCNEIMYIYICMCVYIYIYIYLYCFFMYDIVKMKFKIIVFFCLTKFDCTEKLIVTNLSRK